MSNLQNSIVLERLSEAYELAICDDNELCEALAVATLEPWEYYQYCKEGGELDLEYIYDQIEDKFFDSDVPNFNIRELATQAFDLSL